MSFFETDTRFLTERLHFIFAWQPRTVLVKPGTDPNQIEREGCHKPSSAFGVDLLQASGDETDSIVMIK